MFIHLHKLFIFALLCFYLLRPKNFLNFALNLLNIKICQYFFMLLLPLLVAHSTNTRVVDLWRPLTSDLFDIFNVFPPRQQLKLKFSMSVVILFVGVQGSITDNYNASDDAALLVSSSSSSSAFSVGHRTQSECHRESRPSLNAAWRGNYRLITHTSRFPFFSRTLSGLGQQQIEWKSNSKFKKREAAQKWAVKKRKVRGERRVPVDHFNQMQ